MSQSHRYGCNCFCHEEHSGEESARNSKRPRIEPSLRPAPPSPGYSASKGSPISGHVHSRDYRETISQPNASIDVSNDVFSMFPPYLSSFRNHLTAGDQYMPQQDSGTTQGMAVTSLTGTATVGTFSPRSNDIPFSFDLQNYPNPSPAEPNEQEFAGLGDFTFDSSYQLLWNDTSNLLAVDDKLSWDMSLVNELMQGGDDYIQPRMGSATDTQYNSGENPLVPISLSRSTGPSDEPWSHRPSIGEETIRSLDGQLPENMWTSPANPQTPTLQIPKTKSPSRAANMSTGFSTLRWNNSTVRSGSFQHMGYQKPEKKIFRRPGCRQGPLKPDVAKNASIMRIEKACWACRINKRQCSFGNPCLPCSSQQRSPWNISLCIRAGFPTYLNLFFPDSAFSRFHDENIKELIKNNSHGFTDNQISIEMSSGDSYPRISLTAHEFRPSNQSFLAKDYVISDGRLKKFTPSYAPPLALDGQDLDNLDVKCLTHIKLIIKKDERDPGEVHRGDTSVISWKAFEAVNRYRISSKKFGKNKLLRKATMLYRMHYFLSRIIIFAKGSAEGIVKCLKSPQVLPFEPTLTSTLIDLQLKQAMQTKLREMTLEVLTGLDQALRLPQTKLSWATNFCVILILCMCVEAVQVASDGFAVAKLRKNQPLSESRIEICRKLDERTFTQFTEVFHEVYKTRRPANGKKKRGFNHIRDGIALNDVQEATQPIVDLVNEIRQIMKDHDKEIEETAKNPSFDPKPDLLTHHMEFRKRNSGRLVSKFLRSFIKPM